MGAVLSLGSSTTRAAPTVGATAKDARAVDVDGRVLSLERMRGTTVFVVYEDKESGKQNQALKRELEEWLSHDAKAHASVFVAPVADVSEYDSWPARGFVKDAIREESKKVGMTIWCDWDASFRKTLDLAKGKSNVVVLGRDGRVLFAAEGALSLEQRREAIAAAKREAARTR